MSALIAGSEEKPPLLLIHGLGATKASWLPVVPQLAENHRVTSRTPRLRYLRSCAESTPYLGLRSTPSVPRHGRCEEGIRCRKLARGPRLHRDGDSGARSGARSGLSLSGAGFTHRPASIRQSAASRLWVRRGTLPRQRLKKDLRALFCDPKRINDDWYEAATDDFLQTWKGMRARIATLTALRNIYLDEPHGEEGFWASFSAITSPSLFIYGRRNVLITHRFGTRARADAPLGQGRGVAGLGHSATGAPRSNGGHVDGLLRFCGDRSNSGLTTHFERRVRSLRYANSCDTRFLKEGVFAG